MARRKSRRTRTRSPKTLNLAGIAESALIANAVTVGFFNVSLNDFIFSKDGKNSAGTLTNTAITGRELIAGITGGAGGYGTQSSSLMINPITGGQVVSRYGMPFGAQVKENLKENGAQMVGSLILIPAGFRVFNKLTRKPRATMNKALKMSGLPMKV